VLVHPPRARTLLLLFGFVLRVDLLHPLALSSSGQARLFTCFSHGSPMCRGIRCIDPHQSALFFFPQFLLTYVGSKPLPRRSPRFRTCARFRTPSREYCVYTPLPADVSITTDPRTSRLLLFLLRPPEAELLGRTILVPPTSFLYASLKKLLLLTTAPVFAAGPCTFFGGGSFFIPFCSFLSFVAGFCTRLSRASPRRKARGVPLRKDGG